jgi:hypothetical protein
MRIVGSPIPSPQAGPPSPPHFLLLSAGDGSRQRGRAGTKWGANLLRPAQPDVQAAVDLDLAFDLDLAVDLDS